MKRLFGIALMLMVSMVTSAEEAAEPQVKVDFSEPFTGGEVKASVGTPSEEDGSVVVTLTVTPASGYYITKEDIVVVATYPLPQKQDTRADGDGEETKQTVIAGLLELTGDEPEDLTKERDYYFTLQEGLGAWVQEANFRAIASSGKIGEIKWELTEIEQEESDNKLVLTLEGEGSVTLDDGTAPWAMRASEITDVVVSKGVTELGDGLLSGCTSLENMEIQNNADVVTLGADAIPDNEKLAVDVPGNLMNMYQITEGWKDLKDKIGSKNAVAMAGVKFVEDRNQYDVYVAEKDLMVPAGVTAYDIIGIQGNQILIEEQKILPKGKPMLLYSRDIKTDDDVETDDLFTAVVEQLSKTRAGEGGNDEGEIDEDPVIKCALKVVEYDPDKKEKDQGKEVKLGEVYLLYNDVFYLSQAGVIPVGGIYLEITNEEEEGEQNPQKDPAVKTRMFLTIGAPTDGTPTAIESSMVNGQWSMLKDKWFDLSGRQLNGKPTAKGIYVNSGRKVVIR